MVGNNSYKNSCFRNKWLKMIINKAIKGRLYPNKTQQHKMNVTLGCCRYIYNEMLARNQKSYRRRGEHLSYNTMQNLLPKMKQYKPWLKGADSQALKYACRQVDTAYQKFFKHLANAPRFHKKNGRQSYTTTNMNVVAFDKNKVKLPILGWIRVRGLKPLPDNAKLCMATISREPDGSYYVSVNYKYEEDIKLMPKTKILGLDYKSNGLYADSNGHIAEMPHYFRESQSKVARQQKQLAKKVGSKKGEHKSCGWRKQHKKIAKMQRHIANQRNDYLHKLSKELAESYNVIAIEDLDMRAMSNKGFGNGKATLDNAYGIFTTMLDYKLKYQGKSLVKVSRWYPSSQTCSCCGSKQKIPLATRTYHCKSCGTTINRDYNAARNIKNEAMRLIGA